MTGRWPYMVIAAVAVLGAILIIIGGSLVPFFNNKITNIIKKRELPVNGSDSFEAWLNWSHFKPIYRHFYFLEVTNPDEVVRTGKNITVNETGPYVYRVNFERRNVTFTNNQSDLSYHLHKTYSFERNMSVGDEHELVTIVNLPILNLATRLRFYNNTVQTRLMNETKRLKAGLFTRISVSGALWGYKSYTLLKLLEFLDGYFGLHPLNDSTYGLMYQSGQPKRSSYQGEYDASADSIDSLWKIKEWNGNSSLNVWKNRNCNSINGTDGYSWPPELKQNEDQFIFDSEWCRSLGMSDEEKTWIGNLNTYKYTYDRSTFSYANENKGFCEPTPKENETCLLDGVLNVTKCKDNIPLLLSQPHFLGSNHAYQEAIIGLNPDVGKHASTFNLEPLSGEVVEASRKMQLNAYVMNLKSFPDTAKFAKAHTVVPVVWMKEEYSMADAERDSIHGDITTTRSQYDAIQWALIGIGIFLILCAIVAFIVVWFWRRGRRAEGEGERQPLLH